eukprot:3520847-Rhodomonas_salina.3
MQSHTLAVESVPGMRLISRGGRLHVLGAEVLRVPEKDLRAPYAVSVPDITQYFPVHACPEHSTRRIRTVLANGPRSTLHVRPRNTIVRESRFRQAKQFAARLRRGARTQRETERDFASFRELRDKRRARGTTQPKTTCALAISSVKLL